MRIIQLQAQVLEENCFLVAKDGFCLVIDPGVGTAEPIAQHIASEGWELSAVVLTHMHPDHCWDAARVAGEAPVYVGRGDAVRVADPSLWLGPVIDAQFRQMAGREWEKPASLVEIPHADGVREAFTFPGGFDAYVTGAPGHTPGSILLEFPGRALFVGDVLFAGAAGRTDLPGGSMAQMLQTLEYLRGAPDFDGVVHPGHGPSTTLAKERETNPFLTGKAF